MESISAGLFALKNTLLINPLTRTTSTHHIEAVILTPLKTLEQILPTTSMANLSPHISSMLSPIHSDPHSNEGPLASAADFPPDHWEEPPDSGAEELLLYSPNHGEMPGALHLYPVEDESKRASDEEDHSIKEYDDDNLDEYDDSDDQLGLQ